MTTQERQHSGNSPINPDGSKRGRVDKDVWIAPNVLIGHNVRTRTLDGSKIDRGNGAVEYVFASPEVKTRGGVTVSDDAKIEPCNKIIDVSKVVDTTVPGSGLAVAYNGILTGQMRPSIAANRTLPPSTKDPQGQTRSDIVRQDL
jgi:hypothetical protein